MASWQKGLLRTGCPRLRSPAIRLLMPLVSHCGAALLGLPLCRLAKQLAETITVHNDSQSTTMRLPD
jgi:hypothetical protein